MERGREEEGKSVNLNCLVPTQFALQSSMIEQLRPSSELNPMHIFRTAKPSPVPNYLLYT